MKRIVESDDLVSCDGCGVVFDRLKAGEMRRCPVCEITGPKRPHPKLGRIKQWWSKVEV